VILIQPKAASPRWCQARQSATGARNPGSTLGTVLLYPEGLRMIWGGHLREWTILTRRRTVRQRAEDGPRNEVPADRGPARGEPKALDLADAEIEVVAGAWRAAEIPAVPPW